MDRRYDVLLCDADNTIFDFTKAEENAFAIACAHAGIDGAERLLPVYADINSAMWKLLEESRSLAEVDAILPGEADA